MNKQGPHGGGVRSVVTSKLLEVVLDVEAQA